MVACCFIHSLVHPTLLRTQIPIKGWCMANQFPLFFFVDVIRKHVHIHSQPCWHFGAFDNMYTSIHNPVSLFMLSFHFSFSLLMFFNGLRRCFRFVRRILCCRSRLLDPAEAQKLWVDWTYRSLWRAKRFAQRKDFHLAGEILKLNKARYRTALTVNQ